MGGVVCSSTDDWWWVGGSCSWRTRGHTRVCLQIWTQFLLSLQLCYLKLCLVNSPGFWVCVCSLSMWSLRVLPAWLWSGITSGRLPSSTLTSCPFLHHMLLLYGWYRHGQQSWTSLRFINKRNRNTQTLQVKTISRTSYANKSSAAWTTRLHPDQNPFLKLQSTELPTWRDLCKQDV